MPPTIKPLDASPPYCAAFLAVYKCQFVRLSSVGGTIYPKKCIVAIIHRCRELVLRRQPIVDVERHPSQLGDKLAAKRLFILEASQNPSPAVQHHQYRPRRGLRVERLVHSYSDLIAISRGDLDVGLPRRWLCSTSGRCHFAFATCELGTQLVDVCRCIQAGGRAVGFEQLLALSALSFEV